MNTAKSAVVYCDGSGLATGGPAGIGYVAILDGVYELEGSFELPHATNQQAEILAAAYALHQLDPCVVVAVWSDSQYVVKGMNEWMPDWVRRGWRTSSHREVKNRAHWERLLQAIARHGEVSFFWLRGHAGHDENERADVLAGAARARAGAPV